MNWTRDKSILLSKICVILFAVLLAVLDVGCYWVVGLFGWLRRMTVQTEIGLMVTVYLCSVFGWLLLYRLWSLLGNLQKSEVFIEENVTYLRSVSWYCIWVALICLVSCVCYVSFVFVAIAAAFMALIVRIVKNVFQQAISMKSELDLTV